MLCIYTFHPLDFNENIYSICKKNTYFWNLENDFVIIKNNIHSYLLLLLC